MKKALRLSSSISETKASEDALKDKEGLQVMRNLARNMAFMIKAIADAKEKYGLPKMEHDSFTSFPDGK